MRISLALLSVAFMLSIGCGSTEDDAPTDSGSTTAVETPADETTDTADADTDSADETTTTVSLELPGMTWGGCATSVRGALAGLEKDGTITDLELSPNPAGGKGSFKCAKDVDIAAKLKEAAGDNDHMAGFKISDS